MRRRPVESGGSREAQLDKARTVDLASSRRNERDSRAMDEEGVEGGGGVRLGETCSPLVALRYPFNFDFLLVVVFCFLLFSEDGEAFVKLRRAALWDTPYNSLPGFG